MVDSFAHESIGLEYRINLGALRADVNAMQSMLSKAHLGMISGSKKVEKAFNTVTDASKKMGDEQKKNKQSTESATSALKKMGITSKTTAADLKAMKLSALEYKQVANLTSVQIKKLESATHLSGKAAQVAQARYAILSKRMTEANFLVRKHTGALGDSQRAMERWSLAGLKAMALSQLAWLAMGSVIFGVISAVARGFSDVVQFNQSMKNLQAITSATTKDMNKMEMAIRGAAVRTKFFAADMANAATLLGQAGFSFDEIAESIGAVAVLASATGAELSEVSDLMTTVIRAYDLAANESMRVANVLAAGINKSKLQIDKLRTAMNFVGVSANQFGISIEKTIGLLGTLADRGFKASTMATGFRGILAVLSKETGNFNNVLERLGLSFEDITIRLGQPVEEAIGKIAGAGAMVADIYEGLPRRTAAAFTAIMVNLGAWEDLTEAITGTNRATEMSKIQMEGLDNKLKQIKATFDELVITITDAGENFQAEIDAMAFSLRILGTNLLFVLFARKALAEGLVVFSKDKTFEDWIDEQEKNVERLRKAMFRLWGQDPNQQKGQPKIITQKIDPKIINPQIFDLTVPQLNKRFSELIEERDKLLEEEGKTVDEAIAIWRRYGVKASDAIQQIVNKQNALTTIRIQLINIRDGLKGIGDEGITAANILESKFIKTGVSLSDAIEASMKASKDTISSLNEKLAVVDKDLAERHKLFVDARLKLDSDAAEELLNQRTDIANKIIRLEDKIEKERAALESEKIREANALTARQNKAIRGMDRAATQREKIEDRSAKQKIGIIKQIQKILLSDHEFQILLINEEADERRRSIFSQIEAVKRLQKVLESIALRHPVFSELIDADINKANDLIATLESLLPDVERARDIQIGELRAPGDIAGGLKDSLKDVRDDLSNEYQTWIDLTKATADAMTNTMSDLFFAAMTDELVSLGDAWTVFSRLVRREIANMVSKWVASGLLGDTSGNAGLIARGVGFIADLFGIGGGGKTDIGLTTAHQGGIISAIGAGFKQMHGGGEVTRRLRVGEYVLREPAVRSLGVQNLNYQNRTGQMPAQQRVVNNYNNTYVQAMDVATFDTFLRNSGSRAIHDISLNSVALGRRRRDPRVR